MKYNLMPKMMWFTFKKSFKRQIENLFKEENSSVVMKKAKIKYKEIIYSIDEFSKGDRFLYNILSCAMLSSILLSFSKEYDVEGIRVFYRKAMCENLIMKKFAKKSKAYTKKGRDKLKEQALNSKKNTNPYSWTFDVIDGEDINKYTEVFHSCGICYLMEKLNLEKYIEAMCTLDYDMAALNNTRFTREHTIAKGFAECDCHYDHLTK